MGFYQYISVQTLCTVPTTEQAMYGSQASYNFVKVNNREHMNTT